MEIIDVVGFLITAIIFTLFGKIMYRESIREKIIHETISKATDIVISRLINDGYIKTEGTGNSTVILKHDE
jgi:hypothetical protein